MTNDVGYGDEPKRDDWLATSKIKKPKIEIKTKGVFHHLYINNVHITDSLNKILLESIKSNIEKALGLNP